MADADGVEVGLAPRPGFRAAPSPARGLDAAALGTNRPPVFGGGAAGRDRPGPLRVSSDSCRVFSLNIKGSVRRSNFPAS